jgi:hypothetical protein
MSVRFKFEKKKYVTRKEVKKKLDIKQSSQSVELCDKIGKEIDAQIGENDVNTCAQLLETLYTISQEYTYQLEKQSEYIETGLINTR